MEFRDDVEIERFYGLLEKIKKNNQEILLWQSSDDGTKIKFPVTLKSYIINKISVTISLSISGKEFSQLNKDNIIYLYEEDEGVLFKGKYESWVNGLLKISPDPKVLIKEKRSSDRQNFYYTKVFADFLYGKKLNFNQIRIKDITSFGIGLLVSEKIATGLTIGVESDIKAIHGIELPKPIEGRITHKTSTAKVKGYKAGQVLVGIQFAKESIIINTVSSMFDN